MMWNFNVQADPANGYPPVAPCTPVTQCQKGVRRGIRELSPDVEPMSRRDMLRDTNNERGEVCSVWWPYQPAFKTLFFPEFLGLQVERRHMQQQKAGLFGLSIQIGKPAAAWNSDGVVWDEVE
jgi:hypothetical protein